MIPLDGTPIHPCRLHAAPADVNLAWIRGRRGKEVATIGNQVEGGPRVLRALERLGVGRSVRRADRASATRPIATTDAGQRSDCGAVGSSRGWRRRRVDTSWPCAWSRVDSAGAGAHEGSLDDDGGGLCPHPARSAANATDAERMRSIRYRPVGAPAKDASLGLMLVARGDGAKGLAPSSSAKGTRSRSRPALHDWGSALAEVVATWDPLVTAMTVSLSSLCARTRVKKEKETVITVTAAESRGPIRAPAGLAGAWAPSYTPLSCGATGRRRVFAGCRLLLLRSGRAPPGALEAADAWPDSSGHFRGSSRARLRERAGRGQSKPLAARRCAADARGSEDRDASG
jgi:hypothetical protein